MTSRDAAEVLSLSERQIRRLKAGVKKDGEVFVIHKNRGRKPKLTIPGEIRDQMDASPPYEWIPGIKCSLHGAIDMMPGV